jgi:hypothetical protein
MPTPGMKLWDFRFEVVPGNNAFIIPFDTSRGPILSQASIAAGGALLAPGDYRGRYSPCVVKYAITVTVQPVTLDEQVRTGIAGTSADWTSQAAGSAVPIAITVPVLREFTVNGPDGRILISAGVTGPTTCIIWGAVYQTNDRGS